MSFGGAAEEPRPGRTRQRLELRADAVESEVERLVSLGATRLRDDDGVVELADPDGAVLVLRSELR